MNNESYITVDIGGGVINQTIMDLKGVYDETCGEILE